MPTPCVYMIARNLHSHCGSIGYYNKSRLRLTFVFPYSLSPRHFASCAHVPHDSSAAGSLPVSNAAVRIAKYQTGRGTHGVSLPRATYVAVHEAPEAPVLEQILNEQQ